MSNDNKLLELMNNQLEVNIKKLMSDYIPYIRKLIFNELSTQYTKTDMEKYLSDIFLEVLTNEYEINSESSFNKVLTGIIARRKAIDIHRRNQNKTLIDDTSVELYNTSYDLVRSILLNENNSEFIDDVKSLYEFDFKASMRKYSLNQRIRDISKNTGLKVSSYA